LQVEAILDSVTHMMTTHNDSDSEACMALSDAFLADSRLPIQAARHRIDCAFESGYQALLAALPRDERESEEHPDVRLVERACALLDLETETAVRLSKARYYPADRGDLERVLAWAENVRARARQYLA
jgi:hypothetical protein